MLRQSQHITKAEKYAYVEKVIEMLGMSEYAEAVVGVRGRGLNVERRKLLSIGVELAAKPSLLLFLDEPTTGLDSQSAYGVVNFLRMLADNGQCVLCTIHQPSVTLFQQFDRVMLLVEGGKTAYFGNIGPGSMEMINYFQKYGARLCTQEENPAEYMIEVVSQDSLNWSEIWRNSEENHEVMQTLNQIHHNESNGEAGATKVKGRGLPTRLVEFAMPFHVQLYYVTVRIFQQNWRTPKYVWAKLMLAAASSM